MTQMTQMTNKIKNLLRILILSSFFQLIDCYTYFQCYPSCDINNMSRFSFYQHMTPHFAPNLPTFYFGKIECIGNYQSLWDCRSEFPLNWWTEFQPAELYCQNFHRISAISISECKLIVNTTKSVEYRNFVYHFTSFQKNFKILNFAIVFPWLIIFGLCFTITNIQVHKYRYFEKTRSIGLYVVFQLFKFLLVMTFYSIVVGLHNDDLETISSFRDNWLLYYIICFFCFPLFSLILICSSFELKLFRVIQKQKVC